MQSFIGLLGLIFEINCKNWQFITVFVIKTTHRCGHVGYKILMRLARMIFCDHAWATLKTQQVIWSCVQVRMDLVYSFFRSALIFKADDGNQLRNHTFTYPHPRPDTHIHNYLNQTHTHTHRTHPHPHTPHTYTTPTQTHPHIHTCQCILS